MPDQHCLFSPSGSSRWLQCSASLLPGGEESEDKGHAAEGTVKTVAAPVEALGDSMKGEDTPDKIVTSPVEKGGETVYDATVNTGKTVTGQKVE